MEVVSSPAASVRPLQVFPAVVRRGFRRPCLQRSCPGAANAPVSTDRVFRCVLASLPCQPVAMEVVVDFQRYPAAQ